MKKYIIPAIAVILILICVIILLPAPEPDHCAICDSIPYHAPCLVNLATGEVGELEVYDPHPFKVAELNDYQQGGTYSFLYVAGLNGYRDTANWETHITIPSDKNEYEEKFFCRSCREKIEGHAEDGYLLLDLRNPEIFSILAIDPGQGMTIRCYEVQIIQNDHEKEIIVSGKLKIIDHIIQ